MDEIGKEKIRQSIKKLWQDPEYRKIQVEAHTGKYGKEKHPCWKGGIDNPNLTYYKKKNTPRDIWSKKISDGIKKHFKNGMPQSTKDKISIKNKGKTAWNKNIPCSEITKERIRIKSINRKRFPCSDETKIKIGKANSGENCNFWKGGISLEKYTPAWTNTLKRSIRERDNYICQLCNKIQGEVAHCVHHINYNKQDCSPKNLITLCRNCHTATNIKREYYEKLLKDIMEKYE